MDAGETPQHRRPTTDRASTVRVPPDQLPADLVRAVLTAARAAERADQIPPLNDDQLIALDHPEAVPDGSTVTHLVANGQDAAVDGYAQLQSVSSTSSAAGTATGTLFVAPDRRGRGLGHRLLDAALAQADSARVSLWAPGDHPAARLLAHHAGLETVRTLLIMSRPLDDSLPAATAPDGIEIRPLDPTPGPENDVNAFLSVNARAFAHHPEQGRLDARGFAAKASEPWFDPAGFFLAVDHRQTDPALPGHVHDGRVLGFHWTKRRGPAPDDSGLEIGEVYVIGVDPDAEGRGLAKALLSRGLDRLRDGGAQQVILYVEGDHDRAVGLYERYGFSVSRRDVMYARHLDAETTS